LRSGVPAYEDGVDGKHDHCPISECLANAGDGIAGALRDGLFG
jgi:hypothetical protein